MAGYCQGGDAWRSYVHPATENKGSNWPEETWNLMRDVGSYFLRDRIWRPSSVSGGGERSMDDVAFMRLRGFFNGVITAALWYDTDHPQPLISAAQWQRELDPVLDGHAQMLGLRWPVGPWNEDIDHTDATTQGPALFMALLDTGKYELLVPSAAVRNPGESAYRAAMDGCCKDSRTAGICLHIRENNLTDVDDHRAKYPDKRLFITEFGFEQVSDENERIRIAEAFVLKWLPDPMIGGIAWFTLPCKGGAWASHYQTANEYANWKKLVTYWRHSRMYPQDALAPPSEPAIPANGGATAAAYPGVWADWVNAGGPENNFRKHLLGLGTIVPTHDDLVLVANEMVSSANQVKEVVDHLPFPSSR